MNKAAYVYLLLIVWLLPACSQQSPGSAVPTSERVALRLPQLKPEATAQGAPASYTTGVLTVDGPCIRVQEKDTSFLIIWAADFKLEDDAIIETQTMKRVTFGDTVTVTGGMMPDGWQSATELAVPVDKRCGGPYWLGAGLL